MIVKNEQHNLARCLNSIRDYVDEIVIVDTGSTDSTVEIAKGFGARVIEEPWRDNFSRARNTGLEHAGGDWILFLDADEEVLPGNRQYLRNLGDSRFDGYFLQIINVNDDGSIVRQPALRLFRNHPRHRFKGAIHEQIIQSIFANNPGARMANLDIKIKHYGYQGKLVNRQDKIKRNLTILQKQYDKGEIDGFLLYNLGSEYIRIGELEKALHYFRQAESLTPPEISYNHLLGKKKIQTLILLNEYRAALESIDKYLDLYPDYTDLWFLKAVLYYRKAMYPEALQLYQKCLELGEPPSCYVSENGVGSYKAQNAIRQIKALIAADSKKKTAPSGISLCMIVCNEEKNLARCLNSVHNLVDEIIIVDTGSVDNTARVARSYGALVYDFPWDGNFSAARNFSLSLATGRWILVLDADEELRIEEHSLLRETVAGAQNCQGFYLKVVNYFSPADDDDYVIDAVCRLFRNKPEFKFQGRLHEEIAQSIITHCGADSILPAEIHIDHRGYLQKPVVARKNRRNITILNFQLQEHPGAYTLYALGTELFQQGDYRGALEQYNKALDRLKDGEALSDLYFKAAVCHLELKQYRQGLEVLQRGQRLFPDFTGLWYLQGVMEFQQNLLQQARKTWETALAMGDPPWYRYTFPHGIGTFRTAAALAGCLEKMNLPEQAETLLAGYIDKKEGLGSVILPYCRVLVNKYGAAGCLEKIKAKNMPTCFRESFLLADAFVRLEQYDAAQVFIIKCLEFLKQRPQPQQFLQLAGLQLGLAGRHCSRGIETAGLSPVLSALKQKIFSA